MAQLRGKLPPGWRIEARFEKGARGLTLRGQDGRRATFHVVLRTALAPRDVAGLAPAAKPPTMVISRFLGQRTQALLAQAGISYADATGNLRVVASSPAIYLQSAGAPQDPARVPRPLGSLRGAAAARVVRVLCEVTQPVGVRALAEATQTSLGTASRVVSFLATEALLTRGDAKQIVTVDRPALLTRWAQDYNLGTSNGMRAFLEPRGLGALWPKLATLPQYAATGTVAGVGIAPPRLAMIYVDDIDAAAAALELTETDAGANVWLLQPYDDVVFEGTRAVRVQAGATTATITVVSQAQAAVDLLTSPGRGPQEGEALLADIKPLALAYKGHA